MKNGPRAVREARPTDPTASGDRVSSFGADDLHSVVEKPVAPEVVAGPGAIALPLGVDLDVHVEVRKRARVDRDPVLLEVEGLQVVGLDRTRPRDLVVRPRDFRENASRPITERHDEAVARRGVGDHEGHVCRAASEENDHECRQRVLEHRNSLQ